MVFLFLVTTCKESSAFKIQVGDSSSSRPRRALKLGSSICFPEPKGISGKCQKWHARSETKWLATKFGSESVRHFCRRVRGEFFWCVYIYFPRAMAGEREGVENCSCAHPLSFVNGCCCACLQEALRGEGGSSSFRLRASLRRTRSSELSLHV